MSTAVKERANSVPVTAADLVTRMNVILSAKRKRLFLEAGRSKYVLVDFTKGTEVNLVEFADKLGCREPFETLIGEIT